MGGLVTRKTLNQSIFNENGANRSINKWKGCEWDVIKSKRIWQDFGAISYFIMLTIPG